MPRRATKGKGRASCAGTGAETLLCLAHLLFPAALSGCLPKERMQFSIWKEEWLGSAGSSSAAHVQIWGNKLNALPSLGAPGRCQVRAGDPPTSAASYQRCASVTGGHLLHQQGHGSCVPIGKGSQTGIAASHF